MRHTDSKPNIITVALSPCWDVTCQVPGLDWGVHAKMDSQTCRPAGKSLNVSRALNWIGIPSIAAGLWGADDYHELTADLAEWAQYIQPAMTAVPGKTRHNITLIDQHRASELHLRAPNTLATLDAIKQLRLDLDKISLTDRTCVFAGSMPDGTELDAVLDLVSHCKNQGARIVVDTSGPALRRMVNSQTVDLIKPNVEELEELLGEDIPDQIIPIAQAAIELTSKVPAIVISRGANGAIAVTADGACAAQHKNRDRHIASTVGCGDYLLAGFLAAWYKESIDQCLITAIKTGTAKAWNLPDNTTWHDAKKQIQLTLSIMQYGP